MRRLASLLGDKKQPCCSIYEKGLGSPSYILATIKWPISPVKRAPVALRINFRHSFIFDVQLTPFDELVQRLCHDALLDLPAPVDDLVRPAVVHLQHRHQVVAVARLDRLSAGQARPLIIKQNARHFRLCDHLHYVTRPCDVGHMTV